MIIGVNVSVASERGPEQHVADVETVEYLHVYRIRVLCWSKIIGLRTPLSALQPREQLLHLMHIGYTFVVVITYSYVLLH